MSLTVEEIVTVVKALPPEDQTHIRQTLDAGPPQPAMTEAEYADYLAARGIIRRRQPAGEPPDWHRNFKPIKVEGKPVSETIIEERI